MAASLTPLCQDKLANQQRQVAVTAMGHAVTRVEPTRRVRGLDAHRPDSFVPVAGMFYCQHPPNLEQVRQLVAQAMADVEGSKAELVIFNGVWSGLSQLPKVIQRLAVTRLLIVADDFDPAFDELLRLGSNSVQVMAVSQIQGNPDLIHVDFRPSDLFRATR